MPLARGVFEAANFDGEQTVTYEHIGRVTTPARKRKLPAISASDPRPDLAPCAADKDRFKSEEAAQARADRYGGDVYHCAWCDGWHVVKRRGRWQGEWW